MQVAGAPGKNVEITARDALRLVQNLAKRHQLSKRGKTWFEKAVEWVPDLIGSDYVK